MSAPEVIWARANPRDPATAAAQLVRMAGGGADRPYKLAGADYRAGIVERPLFQTRIGFGEDGWTGNGDSEIAGILRHDDGSIVQRLQKSALFPELDEAREGDLFKDPFNREFRRVSDADAVLTIDGTPLTYDGVPLYSAWVREDPSAVLGGVGGLGVRSSSGSALDDPDVLNTLRPALKVPSSVTIAANSAGVTITSLPLTVVAQACQGNANVNAATGFAVSASGGIEASVNNVEGSADRGKVSITRADAPGKIVVTATFASGLTDSATIAVNRTVASAPTGGGSGSTSFSDGSWEFVNSDVFDQVTDEGAIVQSDASGFLKFRASAAYFGANGLRVTIVARFRPSGGGAWTNATAEVQGSQVVNQGGFEPEILEGYVEIGETSVNTGSASTNFEVALFARRSAGTATADFFNADFQVYQ